MSRARSRRPATSSATTPTTMRGCRCSATTGLVEDIADARPGHRGRHRRRSAAVVPLPVRGRVDRPARAGGGHRVGLPRTSAGTSGSRTGIRPAARRSSRTDRRRRHARPRRRDRDPGPRVAAPRRSTRCRGPSDGCARPVRRFVRIDAPRRGPGRTELGVSGRGRPTAAVLAVDGGNSKTDVALLAQDGRLLAAVRGPTISHQAGRACRRDGRGSSRSSRPRGRGPGWPTAPPADVGAYTLAGADTPGDVRRLTAALAADRGRARHAGRERRVRRPSGPARNGAGVSASSAARGSTPRGSRPTAGRARLAALGDISGDWGGGRDVGTAALGAAVRARDGRGPRTTLEAMVPATSVSRRPLDVTNAIEFGRLDDDRLRELSPVVFAAARGGDAVARSIIDRLADEVAAMAPRDHPAPASGPPRRRCRARRWRVPGAGPGLRGAHREPDPRRGPRGHRPPARCAPGPRVRRSTGSTICPA